VAQGDIGANELTGESKTYTLEERNSSGVSGEIMFEERVDGSTLATFNLQGTPSDGMHPAHIHMNSAAEGGDIAITFSTIDGSNGMSITQIEATNAGDAIAYSDLLEYDGYVNVHLSADDLSVVAQGDIGANELTGDSMTYMLEERNSSGVSGELIFEERMDGSFLATFELMGTPSDGMHPAHIHMNSASEGGDIVVTFNTIDGSTAMSMTQIEALDNGDSFSYSDVTDYDGYVNVHQSANDLTVVSQSNIGSNAN
jgi:hypothetical protein